MSPSIRSTIARARRNGFSLAEVIVFSMLLLLMMQGLYLLLVSGMRNAMYAQAYQTAQQQALIAIRKMVGELSDARSDPGLLIYSQSPPLNSSIVFLSGMAPTASPPAGILIHNPNTGDVTWQKFVGYRVETINGVSNLVREESVSGGVPMTFQYPLTGATTPITSPSPVAFPGAGWNHKLLVARNITYLNFESANTGSQPIGITTILYAEDQTASDRSTEVRYQVTAWLSN